MIKFYILLMAFFTLSCNAQSPIVSYNTFSGDIPDNAYVKDIDNEIDKFVGTWKYLDNEKEFIVELVKRESVFNGSHYVDKLSGQYKYTVNGVVIVNTLSTNVNIHPKINGAGLNDDDKNVFWLDVRDPDKQRAGYQLTLEFQPGLGSHKLKWDVLQTGFHTSYAPGQIPPTPEELDQTMRIPKSILLTKQ